MKKFAALVLSVLFFQQAFAYISQTNYRWRNDNGTEITATWKANQNQPAVIVGQGNFRLRMAFTNEDFYNTASSGNQYLQYAVMGTYSFVDVTNSPNAAFMLAGTSSHVSNNTPTTEQLSIESGYTFSSGLLFTSTDAYLYSIPPRRKYEYEWVLKPGNTIQANTSYEFRLSNASVYNYALLTTSGILPLNIVSLTVDLVNRGAQVKWETSNEENVSHIELERSADGNNFYKIYQVSASGNGSGSSSYSYIDQNPYRISYYRLKIVDQDGSLTYSKILPFSLKGQEEMLSIYPNPAKDQLTIQLTAPAGKVTIYLYDGSGRIVKAFNAESDGSLQKATADISRLHKGIYFIKCNQQVIRFIKD